MSGVSEGSKAGYLTVDDLVRLRKPPELPIQNIGDKLYVPSDDPEEQALVQSLLEAQKVLLTQQRVARITDLIVAEWDEQHQRSVTKRLKGKFTQHMGQHIIGNEIILSPEETVFLMESGCLELNYGGMPLSTEEAYAVVLSGNLALEKYQVYSHLSRLGYLVVLHQEKLGHTVPEKPKGKTCKHKRKSKRKKKHIQVDTLVKKAKSSDSQELSNVLSSAQSNNACDTDRVPEVGMSGLVTSFVNTVSETSRKELGSFEQEKYNTVIQENEVSSVLDRVEKVNEENVENYIVVDSAADDEDERQDRNVDQNKELNVVESDGGEKECVKEVSTIENVASDKVSKLQACSGMHNVHYDNEDDIVVDSAVDEGEKEDRSSDQNEELNVMESDGGERECVKEASTVESVTSDKVSELRDCSEMRHVGNDHAVFREKETPANFPPKGDSKADTAVDSSSSDIICDDDESQEIFEEENVEDEEEEMMNISSEDADNSIQSVVGIDTDETTGEDIVAPKDSDILFVEVTKKETTPLAVIDLFSDEEGDVERRKDAQGESNVTSAANKDQDDDDEIQIIEECRQPSSSSIQHRKRKNKLWPLLNTPLKNETCCYPVAKIDHEFNNAVKWPFPNLLRKTLVCLPRPPTHLLPLNVRMAKEAYTLDLRTLCTNNNSAPTPRLWNSYKDLQARRRNQERSNFRGSPWNISAERDYGRNSNFQSFDSGRHGAFRNVGSSSRDHMLEHMNPNFQPLGPRSPVVKTDPMNSSFQPLGASIPMVKPENVNRGDGILPLPQQPPMPVHPSQVNDYVNFATRAAMQVAQNVLYSMTRNLPIPLNIQQSPPFLGNVNFSISPEQNFSPLMDMNRSVATLPDSTSEHFRPPFQDNIMSSPEYNQSGPAPNVWQNTSPWANGAPPFENQRDGRFSRNSFGQDNNWERGGDQWENPFPSEIPKVQKRVSSWREVKSCLGNDANANNDDDGDEISEVPINVNEVLWSKTISPLVKPKSDVLEDVLKSLQVTKPADLEKGNVISNRFMPAACSLEFTFDVYLPGVTYKRANPVVPNHRIVVVRAIDPFPRTSDIVFLQQKFKDDSCLQFAVVDAGNIAFYSFNNVCLPTLYFGEEEELVN